MNEALQPDVRQIRNRLDFVLDLRLTRMSEILLLHVDDTGID
jgi:hypothetical protein